VPISLPNLDDRRYDDLVEEARALIPTYAPEWTNHNASDPGITLVELFAHLTEMLIYRLNRVTDANVHAFLRLINGAGTKPPTREALAAAIRDTVLELRRVERAVTSEDFERAALAADPEAARALCVHGYDLEQTMGRKAGHVSVVVLPSPGAEEAAPAADPAPSARLVSKIAEDLERRRLLTTHVHVVGPRYLKVGVRLTLRLQPDAPDDTGPRAEAALRRFLHPQFGGAGGAGWPFGRSIYVSEIYDLLDRQPGVDFVTRRTDPVTRQPLDELTTADAARLRRNEAGQLVAVNLEADELVSVNIEPLTLEVVRPKSRR
jgi:hypothetical protein